MEKEQENLYKVYCCRLEEERNSVITKRLLVITFILALIGLLVLNLTGNQSAGFISGYIKSWIVCFFVVFITYYLLPYKEKWIKKPLTQRQASLMIANIIRKDIESQSQECMQEKKFKNPSRCKTCAYDYWQNEEKKLLTLIEGNLGE